MRKVSDYTEKMLNNWAVWSVKSGDGGIGYPRRSVEGRMLDDGGVLPGGSGLKVMPVDSDAEYVEKLVVELTMTYPELGQAVKVEYLEYGNTEMKADIMKTSRTTYAFIRDSAKFWIDGRLKRKGF